MSSWVCIWHRAKLLFWGAGLFGFPAGMKTVVVQSWLSAVQNSSGGLSPCDNRAGNAGSVGWQCTAQGTAEVLCCPQHREPLTKFSENSCISVLLD